MIRCGMCGRELRRGDAYATMMVDGRSVYVCNACFPTQKEKGK